MVAVMADPEFEALQVWYRPERLRAYLRLWPYRDCKAPPPDPEVAWLIRQATGFGPNEGWIKARARWGDVGAALDWLAGVDERAELCVRLYFSVGMTYREVARSLRPHVAPSTAHAYVRDGVLNMSAYLCGGIPRR